MPASIALPAEFAGEPAVARSTGAARFTLDGSDELEKHLARTCEKVLIEVQKNVPSRKLEALLLGGGYGRDEGGVLKTEAGDRPYNDLEFYVFIRGNNWPDERQFDGALHRLAHELTPETGVKLEFKIISSAKLRRSPASMFYYDLGAGHCRLLGEKDLLGGCEHHRNAQNIPLSEATRLLMNRCTGLLLAREKLEREFFTDDDADFVGRNHAKAQLAFGDAVLTVFGQYHWSCLERHERLRQLSEPKELPWFDEACRHHGAGVKFKLHPQQTPVSRTELQTQHEAVTAFALKVWLWLENRRLGCDFKSARDYVLNPTSKCAGTNPWRNRLTNVKAFGPATFFSIRGCHHPYERILNTLALLLWEVPSSNSELQRWIRNELGQSSDNEANLVKIYQKLWYQFN